MIPEIIIRKIDRYIWKNKQKQVNKEYVTVYEYIDHIYCYGVLRRKRCDGMLYNWRSNYIYNGIIYNKEIYNKNLQIVGKLSKNYVHAQLYKN